MLTILVISTAAGCLLAEISIRAFGGAYFRVQLKTLGKIMADFSSANGDDERQALLIKSGKSTIKFSLVLIVLLAAISVIAAFAPWFLDWNTDEQLIYLVATSVAATAWWFVRGFLRRKFDKRGVTAELAPKPTYNALDRLLHRVALGPESVRNLAFELERSYALPHREKSSATDTQSALNPEDGAVYVCGLARSGTTTLLRILGDIKVFRSLAYRDMPFVLAPNLWKQFTKYSRKTPVALERAHGDGIAVDFDSPEGFEVVFWRTFSCLSGDSTCLGFEEPSAAALASFAEYRAIVSNPRCEPKRVGEPPNRYLSKNNNNLMRLRSLGSDRTATILLVYRDPISTARSLHRQHQKFCIEQRTDRFTKEYMGWLVHHEFGLDHRPFCFAISMMESALKPEDLDYWLEYWNAVYSYVLTQCDSGFVLFNHDGLRSNPTAVLEKLLEVLKIDADAPLLARQVTPQTTAAKQLSGFRIDIVERSYDTYRRLLTSPQNLIQFENVGAFGT